MAAVTATTEKFGNKAGSHLTRVSGTGTANTDATLTASAGGEAKRLMYAYVAYSGGVTQTGVTFVLDSGLGSAFDITLSTGSADVQFSLYSPDEEIWLMPNDALAVTALGGGAGDIASLVVCFEGK